MSLKRQEERERQSQREKKRERMWVTEIGKKDSAVLFYVLPIFSDCLRDEIKLPIIPFSPSSASVNIAGGSRKLCSAKTCENF